MTRSRFFVLLLAVMTRTAMASFTVYDATLYVGKPDSIARDFVPMEIIDSHQLWGGKEGQDAPPATTLQRIASRAPADRPIVLDIEHWSTVGADVSATISRFKAVISSIREYNRNLAIGLYSTVPRRDYWRAIGAQGPRAHDAWVAENTELLPLADLVDVMFPCAYTFYSDQKGWEDYARSQILEARRLGKGKPVLLFIWPEYHDSSRNRDQFLPRNFWATQLRLACELADGIVIWGGWDFAKNRRRAWDSEAPWWIETEEFIAKANLCKEDPHDDPSR